MAYRFIRFPNGLAKAVTLSYDDGCAEDAILEKMIASYGMKCTFNVGSNVNHATAIERLLTFLSHGHEIAIHGERHLANGLVTPAEGIRDVLNCRELLENLFDKIIRGMAYPDAGVRKFTDCPDYTVVKDYLKSLGIVYARTAGKSGNLDLPRDWHNWMPTSHHADPNLFSYIDNFLAYDPANKYWDSKDAKLFYLWGHAYEFENNDYGWQHLEKICKILGNKKDIWYATNIEICEYVMAYYSLVFNSKGTKVYNPTVKTLWFDYKNKIYKIEPNETIDIL